MARWQWLLLRITRRLWVRASLIGLLGGFTAIIAALAEPYIPWDLPATIGAEAVDNILNIIASSMLAVTTFSLSIMVAAYASATSNVTPRATRLLMEDRVTQNVLSTFIGSFLFAIVGIIILSTGAYGTRGRAILYLVTIGVIALIVISLLRWIDHLTRLGRVGETTDRVEAATREAMKARLKAPYLGGRPAQGNTAPALRVVTRTVGYVQHLDMAALDACAEAMDREIIVSALPGAFAQPGTVLALVAAGKDGIPDDAMDEAIARAFTIGTERSFEQDPRFGLAVLGEIGNRALSQAINDSGTAIDVIGRMTRLLAYWAAGAEEQEEPRFVRVCVPPLAPADLFEDAFLLLARDGADKIEVQIRLQKALRALARMGMADFRAAALAQAALAESRAMAALPHDADKERLRETIMAAQNK